MSRSDPLESWNLALNALVEPSDRTSESTRVVSRAVQFALVMALEQIGALRGGWRDARHTCFHVLRNGPIPSAPHGPSRNLREVHALDWGPAITLRREEVLRVSSSQIRRSARFAHTSAGEWLFCRPARSAFAGILWLEFSGAGQATDAQARCVANSLASVVELSERLQPDGVSRRLDALARSAGAWIHDIKHLFQLASLSAEIVRAGSDAPTERALESLMASLRDARTLCDRALKEGHYVPKRAVLPLRPLLMRETSAAASISGRCQLVHVALECAQDLTVLADASTLSRIVRNLVLNAIAASPDGGAVSVRARAIDGDACELRVEDRGRGMAFEEHRRLMECGRSGGAGAGFGTSSVADCVAVIDGRIEVESRLGEGTAARVVFPRAAAANESRRVLIVANDARRRASIALEFLAAGWRAFEAADASHAARVLAERGPAHVVVLRGTPSEEWRSVHDSLQESGRRLVVLSIVEGEARESVARAIERLGRVVPETRSERADANASSRGFVEARFER